MQTLTFKQLRPMVNADIKTNIAPILLGMPGIGKSKFLEDLARVYKTRVFTIPINQLADRADLTGARITEHEDEFTPGVKNYQQEFFPHATLMQAISYANAHPDETPIIFLDEINRAGSDITSAALSFITLRRIGTMDFPKNIRFVAAGNDEGNVTSLDEASLSRFSIYKAMPDLETFLSIQEVNPYIKDVLQKNPTLLVAPKLDDEMVTTVDDDEEDDPSAMVLEFGMDGDSFDQITVPRTIETTSKWLDALGLDNTGSPEEIAMIRDLTTDVTQSDNPQSVLFAGLVGHTGYTDFTIKLYETIEEAQLNRIAGAVSNAQTTLLSRFRPSQDTINKLSRATNTSDIENLISSIDASELENAVVWLFESQSVSEIGQLDAVTNFIKIGAQNITAFSQAPLQGIMSIIGNAATLSEKSVKAFLDSGSTVAVQLKPMIGAATGIGA